MRYQLFSIRSPFGYSRWGNRGVTHSRKYVILLRPFDSLFRLAWSRRVTRRILRICAFLGSLSFFSPLLLLNVFLLPWDAVLQGFLTNELFLSWSPPILHFYFPSTRQAFNLTAGGFMPDLSVYLWKCLGRGIRVLFFRVHIVLIRHF